ncbi:MAG: hypothetical protein EB015_05985 [Methylocystaceae bacterium]|nr:hypothetical protein [Methylocystaceae bacterium]
MAISKLGASNKWVEIASSSPTSGTTVSFTSIPEYKDLAILAYNINNGGSSTALSVRFNNDTGSNYTKNVIYQNSGTQVLNIATSPSTTSLYGTYSANVPVAMQLVIEGANSGFKQIFGKIFDYSGYESIGLWHSADVINRIDVISSVSYSAGTIKLFGRN